MEKIKCEDFLHKHTKIKQLEDFAHVLKHLYPDLLVTPSTYLCYNTFRTMGVNFYARGANIIFRHSI